MNLALVKFRRCLRKMPRVWLGEMVEPIFNRGQLLAFLASVIALSLLLQSASPEERDMLALDWAIGVQAFAIALLAWAIISLVRAPFLIVRDDRAKLIVRANRFIYRTPLLIFTERCKPTGKIEMHKFKVPDVEPGSFIYYSIEVEGAGGLAEIGLGGKVLGMLLSTRNWPGTGGTQLPSNNVAIFQIRLPMEAVSTTVRIYCLNFIVGKHDDQDGTTGNHQFPFRPTFEGGDAKPIP